MMYEKLLIAVCWRREFLEKGNVRVRFKIQGLICVPLLLCLNFFTVLYCQFSKKILNIKVRI